MIGETDLSVLIKAMDPVLNEGDFVFCTLKDSGTIVREDILCEFREKEGVTLVLEKNKADALKLPYNFISAWITLRVHSSLEAVGLTAVFSTALAKNNVSANVIAGYFHDHIFVHKKDAAKAIDVLKNLSDNYK